MSGGKVVIVGAGVAGLTLASRLVEGGIDVVVVEREAQPGGLARSFRYDNGSTFDIGPHRFHTDDPQVQRFIEETLNGNITTIARDSQLFLFGKYLPWPITLKTVFSLPPQMLFRSGMDLLLPKRAKTESFEDYIIERYGRTLYRAFFKPYTEKFLQYTCSNLHRDWASAGINRATIDKKVDTSSLFALVKSVLFSENPDTKFLYPKDGGIRAFADALAAGIKKRGGRMLMCTRISDFEVVDETIVSVTTDAGERVPTSYVFWSGGLGDLHEVGRAPASLPPMHYMSTVFYNYVVSKCSPHTFQWCYFGDEDVRIHRISVPRRFNPANVPPTKEALCIEVTCTEDSNVWRDPHRIDCLIETFLLQARLIESLDAVEDVHVERVRQTYPLYTLNYPRKLEATIAWARSQWRNLALLGRTGRFWYNNMDHSIAASLTVAERFLADSRAGRLQAPERYSSEDRGLGQQ